MKNNNWSSLNIKKKFLYILVVMFWVASVVIGFIAFIFLMEAPLNVIGISALWASICCVIVSISLHFNLQMMEFDTKVNRHLNDIDNVLEKLQNDANEAQSQMMEFDTEVNRRLNDIDHVLGRLQNDANESQRKE